MKAKKRRIFLWLCTLVTPWILPLPVLAGGESTLSLNVSGKVMAASMWRDAAGQPIQAVTFSFGSVAASALGNVDSAPYGIKLVNVPSYPVTVQLTRPGQCKIGDTPVQDKHVHILHNADPITSNGNLSISSNAAQTLALRFSGEGYYEIASGAVVCDQPGQIRYSF